MTQTFTFDRTSIACRSCHSERSYRTFPEIVVELSLQFVSRPSTTQTLIPNQIAIPLDQAIRRKSERERIENRDDYTLLSRQPNKCVPESGKFLKVSKVKDLTWAMSGSVTPRVWSSLVRGCSERLGFLAFGVLAMLLLKRLRRNHEETSMVEWRRNCSAKRPTRRRLICCVRAYRNAFGPTRRLMLLGRRVVSRKITILDYGFVYGLFWAELLIKPTFSFGGFWGVHDSSHNDNICPICISTLSLYLII